MEPKPKGLYFYKFNKIWFSKTIFITLYKKQLTIYQYPNIKLKSYKTNKEIETIKISTKIQLIFHKNNILCFEDLIFNFTSKENKNFSHKDNFILYKGVPQYYLECEHNIAINEEVLKAYRYKLVDLEYRIEEFDLFVNKNGFIFDSFFFMKHGLEYDMNFVLESNGRDFLILIDGLLTVNLRFKRQVELTYYKIIMNDDNVMLVAMKNGSYYVEIFDLQLNMVYNGTINNFLYNHHQGIILVEKNNGVPRDNDFKTLKEKMNDQNSTCFTTIDQFNTNNIDKTNIKSTLNNTDESIYTLTHINSSNCICIDVKQFNDYLNVDFNIDYFFSKANNKYKIWKKQRDTLENIHSENSFSTKKNKIEKILDYELLILYKFENILYFDIFEDNIIFITRDYIYLNFMDITCRKKRRNEFYIGCNAKELKIYSYDNYKKCEDILDEMFFIILSEIENSIYLNENKIKKVEHFLHKLLMSKLNDRAEKLINNIKNNLEAIICKLYRKGDEKIRKFLDFSCAKIFENLEFAENLFILFNIKNINLYDLLNACKKENKNELFVELYKFYKNDYKEKDKIIDFIWKTGNLKVLNELKLIDASKYNNITKYLNIL
ncbi:hypothetical protein COBT_000471 [Conglomerata obtusa]